MQPHYNACKHTRNTILFSDDRYQQGFIIVLRNVKMDFPLHQLPVLILIQPKWGHLFPRIRITFIQGKTQFTKCRGQRYVQRTCILPFPHSCKWNCPFARFPFRCVRVVAHLIVALHFHPSPVLSSISPGIGRMASSPSLPSFHEVFIDSPSLAKIVPFSAPFKTRQIAIRGRCSSR